MENKKKTKIKVDVPFFHKKIEGKDGPKRVATIQESKNP